MAKQKKKHKIVSAIEKFLSPIFFVFFIALIYLGVFLFSLDFFYKTKFFPRTYIAGIDVSEMDKMTAQKIIEERADSFSQGMIFKKYGMEKKYVPESFGLKINIEATLRDAYNFGREPLTLASIKDKISLLISHRNFKIHYDINQDLLKNFIDNEFIPQNFPVNGGLELIDDNLIYQAGASGEALNKKHLVSNIAQNAQSLSLVPIVVPFEQASSTILKSEIVKGKIESRKLLEKKVDLSFENKNWEIIDHNIKDWLDFVPIQDKKLNRYDFLSEDNFDLDKFFFDSLGLSYLNRDSYNYILTASLSREHLGAFLQEIAKEIDIKSQNAKFKMNGGKLELLKPAEAGRELLIEDNYQAIIEALYEGTEKIELATRETGADITADNIFELGITELIALGESDFSNSPANRRHNIAVASEKLNGILIKPNEEYSLVANIGEVNAESGYLPELVIKENKTIPEYGGGLCQIATTNFRAAVNAGLEITERQNHSYAVSYYNPQGTDATIYIPRPDLRFINDTQGYILLQTRIDGNKLYFEFYGTKDGREVELQGPFYWDRRPDGSFKARWVQIVKKDGLVLRQQEFKSFYDNPAKYH